MKAIVEWRIDPCCQINFLDRRFENKTAFVSGAIIIVDLDGRARPEVLERELLPKVFLFCAVNVGLTRNDT